MYNTKSDYALNKIDKNAIVFKSVTSGYIRLTAADFASVEEFNKWKALSDEDYHDIEKGDRGYERRKLRLIDELAMCAESPEDLLIKAAKARKDKAFVVAIQKLLTAKQFRRCCLYYVDELSLEKIAALEDVSKVAVYYSISTARRKLIAKMPAIFPEIELVKGLSLFLT